MENSEVKIYYISVWSLHLSKIYWKSFTDWT